MKKRIVAIIALVFVLASSLLMQACGKNKSLDYMEDKLSKYVKLSPEDYKNFSVEIDVPNTSERDLPNEIIGVLCDHKITPDEPVTNKKNVTISAGDVANIYYRGYTLDDNNNKVYFDGGCNFTSSSPTALEIGSSSFVVGFEYNLVGKNQQNYATMSKVDSGFLGQNDSFTLTYSVHYADGNIQTAKTAYVDLTDPNLDEKWGEGFSEYFKTHKVVLGEKFATGKDGDDMLTVKTTVESDKAADDDVYFDMQINEAYRITATEETPVLVVEAYFPYNYKEESLQNKTAYFEVFIKTVQDYKTPELNDEFITNTLKISAADLASYDGANLVEKYKNSLLAKLNKEYQNSVNDMIDAAFWKHVMEKAEFKKLPEGDVQSYYDDLMEDVENAYISYQNQYGSSSQYSSIDQFAIQYMSLTADTDWKAQLRADAELSVKQKLVFYYIIREEGFIPNDTERAAIREELYNNFINSYLDYYGVTTSDADYESKLAAAKEAIDAQYDDGYWNTSVEYEFGMRKIRAFAKITHK